MKAPKQATCKSEEESRLATKLRNLEERCRKCHPLSPVLCVTTCKIWKARNEYRKLYARMNKPTFLTTLMNALKNKRRQKILEIVSERNRTIDELQQQLRAFGYFHSQDTIATEYLNPLIDVGVVDESEAYYYETDFGIGLVNLIRNAGEIEDLLPPHSECHEETVLDVLFDAPRSFKQLVKKIPARSLSRVLARLQSAKLLNGNHDRSYVFFFRSKRDPCKEDLSITERKVYGSIYETGISAHQLSRAAEISLRRTYKYLRRLKGKKLIFVRHNPKPYVLTTKGMEIAKALRSLNKLVAATFAVANRFISGDGSGFNTDIASVLVSRKEERTVALAHADSH